MNRRFLAGFVICISLFGCGGSDEPADRPMDSWFNPVDHTKHEFQSYPNYLYRPVIAALIPDAIAALGDAPLLQLSLSEAEHYTDSSLQMPMELRPFLIHGLRKTEATFSVFIADRALWVDSANVGNASDEVVRQPLVIFIDEVPPDVYVTLDAAIDMAEAK